MNRTRSALPAIVVGLAAAALLASCATVNHLDRIRFENPQLSAVLQPPPEPSLDAWYDLSINTEDPIGTVLRIGSSIVKAAEAEKAG